MTGEISGRRRDDVLRVLDYIHGALSAELTLDSLAQLAGLSAHHFHRLFREIVGEPPIAYVKRLRLERAAVWLKHSRRPITDIAFEVGYQTHEAFTRAFKARFGVPPRRFRILNSVAETATELAPRIVRLPPRVIAFVRCVGPYDDAWDTFDELRAWASDHGLSHDSPAVGVYWDDQRITARERTRCDVALVVGAGVEARGEVRLRRLPRGEHAVVRHRGSIEERRRLYDLLYGVWLPAKGRVPAEAPPYEVYPAIPRARRETGLTAEIHVPLLPKRAGRLW